MKPIKAIKLILAGILIVLISSCSSGSKFQKRKYLPGKYKAGRSLNWKTHSAGKSAAETSPKEEADHFDSQEEVHKEQQYPSNDSTNVVQVSNPSSETQASIADNRTKTDLVDEEDEPDLKGESKCASDTRNQINSHQSHRIRPSKQKLKKSEYPGGGGLKILAYFLCIICPPFGVLILYGFSSETGIITGLYLLGSILLVLFIILLFNDMLQLAQAAGIAAALVLLACTSLALRYIREW